MQLSDRERADDPLGRFRAGWRLKARRAKDTWTPGTEPIETAMERTFHDGVKFAAEFLEGGKLAGGRSAFGSTFPSSWPLGVLRKLSRWIPGLVADRT